MNNSNKNHTENDSEVISKSQRKREVTALQDLGKKLTEINQGLFKKCQLPQHLIDAIEEFKRLPNKNEARRRQLQFIGKLMRKVDTTQIEKVLNQSQQQVELEKKKFHQLEIKREELIAGNSDTFDKLIADYPEVDIQHIRQLIRQCQKELSQSKPPLNSRKLFKYLRQVVLESSEARQEHYE